jgi:hypothetical protein
MTPQTEEVIICFVVGAFAHFGRAMINEYGAAVKLLLSE